MLGQVKQLAFVVLTVGMVGIATGCTTVHQPYEAEEQGDHHHNDHDHHHQNQHDDHHNDHDHHDPYADASQTGGESDPEPEIHGEIDGGFGSAEEAVRAAFHAILDRDAVALSRTLLVEYREMAEQVIETLEPHVDEVEQVEVTLIDQPEDSIVLTEVEFLAPGGDSLGTESAYSIEVEGRWFYFIIDPADLTEPAD